MKELQDITARRQRAVMRKIVARRIKIAALAAEVDALQRELDDIAATEAIAWATRGQHRPALPIDPDGLDLLADDDFDLDALDENFEVTR